LICVTHPPTDVVVPMRRAKPGGANDQGSKRGPLVPPTQVLKPWIARDPDIVVQTRKDANRRSSWRAIAEQVLAAIYGHLDRHPNASNDIARWLKRIPRSRARRASQAQIAGRQDRRAAK
jgi:hypothetical protein